MYRLSPSSFLRATAMGCLLVFGLYLTRTEKPNSTTLSNPNEGEIPNFSPNVIPNDAMELRNIIKLKSVVGSRVELGDARRDRSILMNLDIAAIKLDKRSSNDEENTIVDAEEQYSPQFLCGDTIRTGYCVMENFKPAKAYYAYNETITLTTQGTVEFLRHVQVLCPRWQGPISVTVYAPGEDFDIAEDVIERLRSCDGCVKLWVTWHLIFDVTQPPRRTKEPVKLVARNCSATYLFPNTTYVRARNLTYPINVARNVARLSAKTEYIFAADIELYPSLAIIPKFLELIRLRRMLNLTSQREVYALPVFEVKKSVLPPQTKEELVRLYVRKKAESFHRYVCNICHKIPDLENWLRTKPSGPEIPLSVFKTVRRDRKHNLRAWEPFFIGTNEFPLFEERLTWDGKANKMQVMKEMCYLKYDFHIVDGAFLVHAPGIKVFSKAAEKPRVPYARLNKKVFNELSAQWHQLYDNETIRMC